MTIYWMPPRQPKADLQIGSQTIIDVACQDIAGAIADLMSEIVTCEDVGRCLRIHTQLQGLCISLEATCSASLDRADALLKGRD